MKNKLPASILVLFISFNSYCQKFVMNDVYGQGRINRFQQYVGKNDTNYVFNDYLQFYTTIDDNETGKARRSKQIDDISKMITDSLAIDVRALRGMHLPGYHLLIDTSGHIISLVNIGNKQFPNIDDLEKRIMRILKNTKLEVPQLPANATKKKWFWEFQERITIARMGPLANTNK